MRDRSTLSPIITVERALSYVEINEVEDVNNSSLLENNLVPPAQDPLLVDEVVPHALPNQEKVIEAEPETLAPAVFIIVHPQLHQVETSINHSIVSLPKDWLAFKLPSDITNENDNTESWMYLQFNFMAERGAGNFKTDKGIKVSGKNLIYYIMNKPYQGKS